MIFKKTIRTFIGVWIFALILFSQTAFSQETVYKWGDFGVCFAIPNTHKILKNSGEEFESGDDLTWIQMYPFKDATVTAKGMVEGVVKEAGMTILKQGAYQSGGYDGYWVTSESSQYPEWQYWYIGFIDPTSDTNFYAVIWFKKNNKKAYDIANKMSYSFKKTN
jgi:hypothetical protein